MANTKTIKAYFSNDRKYFENSLGSEYNYTQATGPYEYLLGALAGCYASTLSSYERDFNWEELEIEIIATKRETIPTTLENTMLKIKAMGVEDRDGFILLAKRACDECSIYQTISKVSNMDLDIMFEG